MRQLVLATTIALATASAAATAHADARFDSKGWTLLGEKSIDGKVDHDTIQVGRAEGVFTAITLVAAEGDFELDTLTVRFGNKDRFSPDVRWSFKEGSRSRAIDLPGKQRGIDSIELTYKNVRGGRNAKVQVWGREGNSGIVPGNPPPDPNYEADWDESQWTVLGSARASRTRGTVTIPIRTKVRDFTNLTLAVNDGHLQITDVDAIYTRGPRGKNRWGFEFRDGSRRSQLALGGPRKALKAVQIKYVNRAPGRRATIQLWGKVVDSGGVNTAPGLTPGEMKSWKFDATGWTLLGEQSVDGKRDRDRIPVGVREGRFTKMAIVVLDSSLQLDDLTVTFGNQTTWDPKLRHTFQEGSQSQVLDFPANKRIIEHVDLRYSNLPGGGRAKVQIWAK